MRPPRHPSATLLPRVLRALVVAVDNLADQIDGQANTHPLDVVAARAEDLCQLLGRSPSRSRVLASADDLGVLLADCDYVRVGVRLLPWSPRRRYLERFDQAVDNLEAAIAIHELRQTFFAWGVPVVRSRTSTARCSTSSRPSTIRCSTSRMLRQLAFAFDGAAGAHERDQVAHNAPAPRQQALWGKNG